MDMVQGVTYENGGYIYPVCYDETARASIPSSESSIHLSTSDNTSTWHENSISNSVLRVGPIEPGKSYSDSRMANLSQHDVTNVPTNDRTGITNLAFTEDKGDARFHRVVCARDIIQE